MVVGSGERYDENQRLRRRILAEHAELRAAIERVRQAGTPGALVVAASALVDRLSEHIDHEDALLEPVLRTIDAWGEERARRLRQEHALQRSQLARLRDELATAPDRSLAWTVQPFIDALVEDMAAEERDLLTASLLRDDSITVEFGG